MKKILTVVCGVLISGAISFAATLTFENLPVNQQVPDGYGGLNWNNTMWVFERVNPNPSSGFADALPLGAKGAFSGMPYWGVITAPIGETFTLNSAHTASAWWHYETLEVKGYLMGKLMYSTTYELSPTVLTLVEFPPEIVDCVTLKPWVTENGGEPYIDQFLMDSLTINTPQQMVPWKGESAGRLQPVAASTGSAYAIAEGGNATHVGKFTAASTPDPATGVTWITITAANGDEVYGVITKVSGNWPALSFKVVIFDGTGHFKGANGSYVETLTIDPTTGAFTAVSAGTISN
jgi:hypothetical protein